MKIALRCQSCQRRYPSSTTVWKCHCGGLLSVDFHARFPREKIRKRKPSLWRYREALPIEHDRHIISFDEGFTPLTEEHFFGKKVFVKQDHLFPSGSYKDRGASILISKIKELGIRKVVEDSSGKGYFLKKGTEIGKNAGKVKAIFRDKVVIEEIYEDIIGQRKMNEVSLFLQRAEEGGES